MFSPLVSVKILHAFLILRVWFFLCLVFNLLGSPYNFLRCMLIPNTCIGVADVLNDFGNLFLCQIGSLVYVLEIS